jgi:hypothetical protein
MTVSSIGHGSPMNTLEISDFTRSWQDAGIVGHLLAKGRARTSGASMIAGYVGGSDKLDKALCRFARACADQTEADHQPLIKAVARGALPVERAVQGSSRSVSRP